jgi:hypothetical protein
LDTKLVEMITSDCAGEAAHPTIKQVNPTPINTSRLFPVIGMPPDKNRLSRLS